MAEVNVEIKIKKVEQVVRKTVDVEVKTIYLTLSEREAHTLATVLNHVGGDPFNSLRVNAQEILDKLQHNEVYPYQSKEVIEEDVKYTNTIYFKKGAFPKCKSESSGSS